MGDEPQRHGVSRLIPASLQGGTVPGVVEDHFLIPWRPSTFSRLLTTQPFSLCLLPIFLLDRLFPVYSWGEESDGGMDGWVDGWADGPMDVGSPLFCSSLEE